MLYLKKLLSTYLDFFNFWLVGVVVALLLALFAVLSHIDLNTADFWLLIVVGALLMGIIVVVVFYLIVPHTALSQEEHSRKLFIKVYQWRHFTYELSLLVRQINSEKKFKREGLFALQALGVLVNASGVALVDQANTFAEALLHGSKCNLKFRVDNRWNPCMLSYVVTNADNEEMGGYIYLLGDPAKQIK